LEGSVSTRPGVEHPFIFSGKTAPLDRRAALALHLDAGDLLIALI
jgi:hypothetical protein